MQEIARRVAYHDHCPEERTAESHIMTFGFQSLAILIAMTAVVIPLLVHLLRRRRYDVVDWGAMQFLSFSERRRHRLQLEELLLMLLRMGLIALFILALASPFSESSFLPDWMNHEGKDVVLVLDVSTSMGYDNGQEPMPLAQAQKWMEAFLDGLRDGPAA